jgi:transposase
VRARRGPQIAVVATARKLATLAWHLLRSEQDYAYARPSLTRSKLRRLELRCGVAPLTGLEKDSVACGSIPSSSPRCALR